MQRCRSRRDLLQALAPVLVGVLVAGCAAAPRQTESTDYFARAETQVDGCVRASAVVLSPLESENTFALPLASKGIQPVWLELENQEDHALILMLLSIDPD